MSRRRPLRLGHRMMVAFVAFTLLVTAVFGSLAVLFAYAVEDQFIQGLLQREAERQLQHRQEQGSWTAPLESWMQRIEDPAQLPGNIPALLREEPGRVEFAADDGRHYHLVPIRAASGEEFGWMFGEVSELLVIRPQRNAWLKLMAGTGLAMVLLALALGAWLAHRTTATLSGLAARVDASGPDYLAPGLDHPAGDDEAGVLARALHSLVARVRAFVERERAFSRDASHELRTPLTVIRNACEQLNTEPDLPAAARTSLQQIQRSAAQLEQTVDTLLLLAREESSPTSPSPTAVLPLVERVVVEQAHLLDGKAVDLQIEVTPDIRSTLPAPVLNILLANLIGNAFAHSDGGTILIEADSHRLRVSNSGAALPDEAFEAFVKADASTGMGLGLSIVRRLCERYALELRTDCACGQVQLSLALHPADRPCRTMASDSALGR